jgi:hypothetical protein
MKLRYPLLFGPTHFREKTARHLEFKSLLLLQLKHSGIYEHRVPSTPTYVDYQWGGLYRFADFIGFLSVTKNLAFLEKEATASRDVQMGQALLIFRRTEKSPSLL